ncbi:hypothetical protein ShzoTeo12_53630 (plasmid) [Shinella zoogloeoides]|nr:hypothetical protein ShzoTeo12_53630 [Shinella zoogloeoides]
MERQLPSSDPASLEKRLLTLAFAYYTSPAQHSVGSSKISRACRFNPDIEFQADFPLLQASPRRRENPRAGSRSPGRASSSGTSSRNLPVNGSVITAAGCDECVTWHRRAVQTIAAGKVCCCPSPSSGSMPVACGDRRLDESSRPRRCRLDRARRSCRVEMRLHRRRDAGTGDRARRRPGRHSSTPAASTGPAHLRLRDQSRLSPAPAADSCEQTVDRRGGLRRPEEVRA